MFDAVRKASHPIEWLASQKNIEELFSDNIDYVVDACDTITIKLELIRICKRKNIKLISSMGTGNKMDPSRLKIVDIRNTSYDPIAKITRKMVKDERIKGKVYVVCSDEKPRVKINKTIPSNSFVQATSDNGTFFVSPSTIPTI